MFSLAHSARQNDVIMTCVCECHDDKEGPSIIQTSATPLLKATPSSSHITTPNLTSLTPQQLHVLAIATAARALTTPISTVNPLHMSNQQNLPTGTPGSSHTATPITLPLPFPTSSLSNLSSLLSSSKPLASLLPSMILPAGNVTSSNSLLADSKPDVKPQLCTAADSAVSTVSEKNNPTSKSDPSIESINESVSSKKSGESECCSDVKNCQEENAKVQGKDTACISTGVQSSETLEVKGEVNQSVGGALPKVKAEGGEEKEKKATVLPTDLDDDSDFKAPKKRFRTPTAANTANDGPVRVVKCYNILSMCV